MKTSDDKPKKRPAMPGAGRPKGSMSKIAEETRERAQATGLLPHEILLSMARGEPQTVYTPGEDGKVTEQLVALSIDERRDAAKAAAPYYAPKISTVEVITGVGDDELDAIIKGAAAAAGVSIGFGGEGPEGGHEAEQGGGRSRRAIL